MNMHKTSRGTPKGAYIMFKSLKTNTNRMMNEEHGARNGIGIDHDRDLAACQNKLVESTDAMNNSQN